MRSSRLVSRTLSLWLNALEARLDQLEGYMGRVERTEDRVDRLYHQGKVFTVHDLAGGRVIRFGGRSQWWPVGAGGRRGYMAKAGG